MAERPGPGAWRSYDDVADAYARISSICHQQLACDLVEAAAAPFGARVLDLGAGSGVAAAAAVQAVGPEGAVVALDPSAALLTHARHHRVGVVVGAAPGLPFGEAAFDTVVANLVIGHVADYGLALADMVRVLRPGGCLGVTTWGRLDDASPIDDADERAAYAAWDEIVARHVDLETVDEAAAAALPWEAWFLDPARIRVALAEAGLRSVECTGRAYRYPLAHTDWLLRVGTSARARFVRAVMGPDGYAAVEAEVLVALRSQPVPDPIRCADEAIIAVARTPIRGSRPR